MGFIRGVWILTSGQLILSAGPLHSDIIGRTFSSEAFCRNQRFLVQPVGFWYKIYIIIGRRDDFWLEKGEIFRNSSHRANKKFHQSASDLCSSFQTDCLLQYYKCCDLKINSSLTSLYLDQMISGLERAPGESLCNFVQYRDPALTLDNLDTSWRIDEIKHLNPAHDFRPH